jgi:hypothetical protein
MNDQHLSTMGPSVQDNGFDVASYQTLAVDGYVAEPVIAHWQQVGKYRLPLASVYGQNNGGVLRRDFVGELSSRPNNYMPQWSAPSRGSSVNQTGGMINVPMSSYTAGQSVSNPITVNADQASMISRFISSKSPTYAGGLSTSGGE